MTIDILIFGAGAVGAFYGSRLAHAPSVRVSVVCRSNYTAVKTNGFTVHSPQYPTDHFQPYEVFPNAEAAISSSIKIWHYIIVSTKALPDVSDDSALLAGLVSPSTSIVLIQNGLGIEHPYSTRFPHASILSAVTIVSAAQHTAGQIQHNRWTRISIGPYIPSSNSEKENPTATERIQTLISLLHDGGIRDASAYSASSLQLLRWHKVAINAAMNPTSVLTHGAPNATMALDPDLSVHLAGVMEEVFAAARAVTGESDFPQGFASAEEVLRSTRKNTSGSRPSMWADWSGGRRMELEVILGNPIRAAREVGVQMPRCQAMYAMLKRAQAERDERRESKL